MGVSTPLHRLSAGRRYRWSKTTRQEGANRQAAIARPARPPPRGDRLPPDRRPQGFARAGGRERPTPRTPRASGQTVKYPKARRCSTDFWTRATYCPGVSRSSLTPSISMVQGPRKPVSFSRPRM